MTGVSTHVLDTTTGLGYTAIAAAQTAYELITIELYPTVLEVCRLNPWSQELFTNPKIKQCIGDAYDVVEEFKDSFRRYIPQSELDAQKPFDPPAPPDKTN